MATDMSAGGHHLNLLYITRDPAIAAILERCGVDWVFVDLEYTGKAERQAGRDTVKSRHTIDDVRAVRQSISRSDLLVRVNPWGPHSPAEIDQVIEAGADIVMLPYFFKAEEAEAFIAQVNGRARTCLLVETPEACNAIADIVALPGVDHIHIGLNDLHAALGMTFMFEPLAIGLVDTVAETCRRAGVSFGFGGCARIGSLVPPAEDIVAEHYRLGSTSVILSRSFCNTDTMESLEAIEASISSGVAAIRAWESELRGKDPAFFERNRQSVWASIKQVAGN